MIGNDIVDLANTSNWQRKGFLQKIFTFDEHKQIFRSQDPNTTVWQMWSMKEAAYKAISRTNRNIPFNPKLFLCKKNGNNATVTYLDKVLYIKSELTGDYVHSIACADPEYFNNITTYLLDYTLDYVKKFNSKKSSFKLKKDIEGIPYILDKRTGQSIPASISHHGRYLAVVYLLMLHIPNSGD
ncbi:4'-phosphopantetheinyl transferase superfamily protein [Pedobacter cryotolerans]|uniref:4-phosphopantetheinyl transferase family protein n=1 Tax=Pedobacter cryotolerans TaxID=2571270 RepID=A0A4U1C795_9SPHI|nr:4'-phosphopantetheinyl transferase superfamily protein [Pedobacter cryotolerans]TKC01237.1 4-phosphopantetheinyl transferase family protein [Pedobacter cryotolerans]